MNLLQPLLQLLPEWMVALIFRFRAVAAVIAITFAFFIVIALIERAYGATPRRYLSRAFLHDLGYWLYYRCGLHNLLWTGALLWLMTPALDLLRFDLLAGWPVVLRYFTYWVIFDFTAYWVHRWKHASRWLWAFHAVHHSQETLTFTTLTRGHPFESVFGAAIAFIPLVVLGAPPLAWFPLAMVREFLEALQHSAIPWRMGPLYRVIVTPEFHAFHHSTDPTHHDRNFGVNLAVWDFLFGTAVDRQPRPTSFGLTGVSMPTVTSQLIGPFQTLAGGNRRTPRVLGDSVESPRVLGDSSVT